MLERLTGEVGSKNGNALLRAVWQGDADDLHLLSQARHAFMLAIHGLALSRRGVPCVWFPDYFCESGLSSVRRSGAQVAFYPVTNSLTPDWNACREMAVRQRPDLFVLVHYFGREAEGQNARAFCDEVGALLLEDAAHVMRPRGTIARHGDLICYSPNKFFPVPDGGILVVRGSELSQCVAKTAQGQPRARAPAIHWVAKRLVRSIKRHMLPRKPPRPLPTTTLDAELSGTAPFVQLWMSRFSRWRLERSFRSNEAEQLANALLTGHRHLSSCLAGYGDMQPIGFADHLIPYLTVMQCNDETRAGRYLNELRSAGVEAFTWPELPPEVRADQGRHREALRLRRTLLCCTLGWRCNGTLTEFLATLPQNYTPDVWH